MEKIEIPDGGEEGFEDIAQEVAEKIADEPMNYDRFAVASKFRKIYGDDNVNFIEDGSPSIEYEFL